MARLFDAYIVADWTAAETRKLGDNSLWIGVAKRDVRFRLYTETHNVATRAEGEALLKPVKPCPRCPMPNIDPDTAQVHTGVGDTLQGYRQDPRVNGAVTFGMNCMPLAGVGHTLRVGQRVSADWAF